MRYRLEIAPDVQEVIRLLSPSIKQAVRAAIRGLTANPHLGERLHRELEGLFKYRVRRYRIVYRIIDGARLVRIVAVGERRTVYEELAQLARSGGGSGSTRF